MLDDEDLMPDVNNLNVKNVLRSLVEIDGVLLTEKQKTEMQVSLRDHTSPVGKQLTAERSKYKLHMGAKELAKRQRRSIGSIGEPPAMGMDLASIENKFKRILKQVGTMQVEESCRTNTGRPEQWRPAEP